MSRPGAPADPPDGGGSVDMRDRVVKSSIIVLTVVVSLAFLWMIRHFLTALFLAAVFSGMAYPLYGKILRLVRGHTAIASLTTLFIVTLLVLIPLLAVLALVVAQAFQMSQEITPWIDEQLKKDPEEFKLQLPHWVPMRDKLENPDPELVKKVGDVASDIGRFLFGWLGAVTVGTFGLLINLFVMMYAMFWFLKEGPRIREQLMQYSPLPRAIKERIIQKGLSVTRATIKGTLFIGIVQGALAGIAFAVVGIQGAAFWGTIMAVLSIIPGVGSAFVWVPAVIYLAATGQYVEAIGLTIWCMAVVGTVDNLLRPRLVGNDTQMPDLLILISTLGGLTLFGPVGIILGPTLAAIFVTMWDAFKETFKGTSTELAQTWVPEAKRS